jgi:hypothetical protein
MARQPVETARPLADQAATSIQNEPMKPFGQMRKVSYFYGLVVGWRRSADRAGLPANSLLTGNFTGKIRISGLKPAVLEPETAVPQGLISKFPKQPIRELFFAEQGILSG